MKITKMINVRASPLITFNVPNTVQGTKHLVIYQTPNNPTRKVLLLSHLTDEETEVSHS